MKQPLPSKHVLKLWGKALIGHYLPKLIDETSTASRSRGKLWALRSCITSIPRLARLIISPRYYVHDLDYQLQIGWNWNHLSWKSIVLIPKAVNQIPTIGQAARKKCRERELLKLAYWKINRPGRAWAVIENELEKGWERRIMLDDKGGTLKVISGKDGYRCWGIFWWAHWNLLNRLIDRNLMEYSEPTIELRS